MPAHEVLVLLLVLVPETLGLVLEEGGSAVAVAALHRVLDRFLQAWLVLRRAGGEMRVLRFGFIEADLEKVYILAPTLYTLKN